MLSQSRWIVLLLCLAAAGALAQSTPSPIYQHWISEDVAYIINGAGARELSLAGG
jgi:hypothetical protein